MVAGKPVREWLHASLRNRCGYTFRMNLRNTGYEDGRCIELTQNCVQCLSLVLAVLNF